MKFKTILYISLAFAAAVPAVSAEVPYGNSFKDERNLIKKGNAAYEKGDYRSALAIYDEALSINPKSDVALFNQALAYVHLSNPDNRGQKNDPLVKAQEIFQRTSSSAIPDIAEKSFYNLGNMFYKDNKFPESIEFYKEALRINPNNLKTRQNLLLAQKMLDNSGNPNSNDDKEDKDKKQDEKEKQEQQQQQQDQQNQNQPQPQPQPQPNQSAEQILKSVQNKENSTRKRVKAAPQPGKRTTDKPW